MRFKFLLFSLLLLLNYNSHAQSCTVVAKAQLAENISEVKIIHNMSQRELSSSNAELCVGDVVVIPESFAQPVVLDYYSENLEQQQLATGQQHEIMGLEAPCGKWCKLTKNTKRLYMRLTRKNINPPNRIVATERGDNEDFPVSTLITDNQQPLYLFAQQGELGFFWKGGKKPYQLTLKNQQGQTIISQNKLHTKHTQFSLPNVEPNQTYQLILQDKQKKTLQTGIRFRLPPFPLDPDENRLLRLTRLLLDSEHNWRLEVWRQLQALDDSPKVNKFKAHLIVDDF
ncbi:hypothetical protein [Candidatus Albibeggiatoa sp. nov. BB20]|uniref:hypothetical protein n=1 Tax=Candidatus Albibeggiatoa sp. nov. BB20 TaxID=3162723 RepID=UPI0033654255